MAGNEEPAYLPIGTEVSAKYRGAFCEAKVKKLVRLVKCKVTLKEAVGGAQFVVSDVDIKGPVRQGASVEVRKPETQDFVEAVINKVTDCSTYTVVFDDGDENTLRRTQLQPKGEKHFVQSETLDELPLTHPEHFGTPVMKPAKRRSGTPYRDQGGSDSESESDSEEETKRREYRGKVQELVGRVMCIELEDRKRAALLVPVLVVDANATDIELKTKDHFIVRSFKDSKFYAVTKKETKDFSRDMSVNNEDKTLKNAFDKALAFFDSKELPSNWDKEEMLGWDTELEDGDDSDDEQSEEKDLFVAQLFKFMDDRATPINKAPAIGGRDLNLWRLYKVVQNLGGYNRVTNQAKWRQVYAKMGLPPANTPANQIKGAYKKYLHAFEDFYRKLGSSMGTSSGRPARSRHSSGRGLFPVRDRESPRSPRSAEVKKVVKQEVEKEEEKTEKAKEKEAPVPPEKEEKEKEKSKPVAVEEQAEPSPRKVRGRVVTEPEKKAEEPPAPKTEKRVTREDVAKIKEEVKPEEEPPEKKVTKKQVKEEVAKVTAADTKKAEEVKKEPAKKDDAKKGKEDPKKTKEPKVREMVREMELKIKAIKTDEIPTPGKKRLISTPKAGPRSKIPKLDPEQQQTPRSKTPKLDSEQTPRTSKIPKVDPEPTPDAKKKVEPPADKKQKKVVPTVSAVEVQKVEEKPEEKAEEKKEEEEKEDKDDKAAKKGKKKELPVGSKLRVKYGRGQDQKIYEAKIIDAEAEEGTIHYLVHYAGWNTRYDEWILRDRIVSVVEMGSGTVNKVPVGGTKAAKAAKLHVAKKLKILKTNIAGALTPGKTTPSRQTSVSAKAAAAAKQTPGGRPTLGRPPSVTKKPITPASRPTRLSRQSSLDPEPSPKRRRTRRQSVVGGDSGENGDESGESGDEDSKKGQTESGASTPRVEVTDTEAPTTGANTPDAEDSDSENKNESLLDPTTGKMVGSETPSAASITSTDADMEDMITGMKEDVDYMKELEDMEVTDGEAITADAPDLMEAMNYIHSDDTEATSLLDFPEFNDSEPNSGAGTPNSTSSGRGGRGKKREAPAKGKKKAALSRQQSSDSVVAQSPAQKEEISMPLVKTPIVEEKDEEEVEKKVEKKKPVYSAFNSMEDKTEDKAESVAEKVEAAPEAEATDAAPEKPVSVAKSPAHVAAASIAELKTVTGKKAGSQSPRAQLPPGGASPCTDKKTEQDVKQITSQEVKQKVLKPIMASPPHPSSLPAEEVKTKAKAAAAAASPQHTPAVVEDAKPAAPKKTPMSPQRTAASEVESSPKPKKLKTDKKAEKKPKAADKKAKEESVAETSNEPDADVKEQDKKDGDKKKGKKKTKKKVENVDTKDEENKAKEDVIPVPEEDKNLRCDETLDELDDPVKEAPTKVEEKCAEKEEKAGLTCHAEKAHDAPAADANGLKPASQDAVQHPAEPQKPATAPATDSTNTTQGFMDNTPPDTPNQSPSRPPASCSMTPPRSATEATGLPVEALSESVPPPGGESPSACDMSTISNSSCGSSGNMPSSEDSNENQVAPSASKRKHSEETPTAVGSKRRKRSHKRANTAEKGKPGRPPKNQKEASDSDEPMSAEAAVANAMAAMAGMSSAPAPPAPPPAVQRNPAMSPMHTASPGKRSLQPPPDRVSKYNFLNLEKGKYLEGDARIDFLLEQINEMRKVYMSLKSEVACIDRRRKRHRRKQKESERRARRSPQSEENQS